MEEGCICVDNIGFLQKVYKLTEVLQLHDEIIKKNCCHVNNVVDFNLCYTALTDMTNLNSARVYYSINDHSVHSFGRLVFATLLVIL